MRPAKLLLEPRLACCNAAWVLPPPLVLDSGLVADEDLETDSIDAVKAFTQSDVNRGDQGIGPSQP